MNYEENIGKKTQKTTSGRTNNHRRGKPFKSGFMINTIKGIINHEQLNVPAYTFEEDDSYVECKRCEIIGEDVFIITIYDEDDEIAYQENIHYEYELARKIAENIVEKYPDYDDNWIWTLMPKAF